MRGNHQLREVGRLVLRSIPAVCGGPIGYNLVYTVEQGLSPRVRGTHTRTSRNQHMSGSIPACAGDPTWPCLKQRHPRVYPRVCGGPYIGLHLAERVYGLSPRVRGPLNRRIPDPRNFPLVKSSD